MTATPDTSCARCGHAIYATPGGWKTVYVEYDGPTDVCPIQPDESRPAHVPAFAAGTVIEATPAGRKADGTPITRRVRYTLSRPIEEPDFSGPGRARIFTRRTHGPSGRYDKPISVPAVVVNIAYAGE